MTTNTRRSAKQACAQGNLNTLFSYLPDIRQAIYTTNAIESLNSVIRAEIRNARYPGRRLSVEGYLSGDQRCLKKVEYADPALAAGNESFYY